MTINIHGLIPTYRNLTKISHFRGLQMGEYFEILHTKSPYGYNFTPLPSQSAPKGFNKNGAKTDASLAAAKRRFRRLLLCNLSLNTTLLTLSYAENMKDLTKAWVHFRDFRRRMRRSSWFGKYLVVPEFQKRGAVHFHIVLFDAPFLKFKQVKWKHGTFDLIKAKPPIDRLANYLTKYLTKDAIDDRLNARKVYSCSRGLKKPKVHRNAADIAEIAQNYPTTLSETIIKGVKITLKRT